jgi:hypothetical protein
MKPTHTIWALFVAILAVPMAAVGQDEEASTELASGDDAVEDIVVLGQKSVAELRRDVFRSEEDFYSIYNKLNDDNEYDVSCFVETPTGTRIKNHVCRARFITNAYSEQAGRRRATATRLAQNQDENPVIAEKTAKFQKKLETFVATDPELQAALVRYNTARARFKAEHEGSAKH